MSKDETRVLIGGRKLRKIPPQSKLYVESENFHGSVRQRHVLNSIPQGSPYTSSDYCTPPQLQPHQNYHNDSGFYGSFATPDNSPTSHSGLNNTPSPHKSTLWHSLTSPLRNIKNSVTGGGRPTFLDDERSGRWKVKPQQILGWLLFLIIFSSLGFTMLISFKHFGAGGQAGSEIGNGKYQSLKFANEKISAQKHVDVDPEDVSPMEMVMMSDPIYDDSISEELLTTTTKPLVVEHPAPTKAPRARDVERNIKKSSVKSDNIMMDAPLAPISKESSDSAEEVNPPKNSSKSRKKSRSVNPLTKTLKVEKMSKAKIVKKVTTILRDIKSLDYPDLPTFRGPKVDSDETDDEALKNDDVDYPEDPYYSGIIRSNI